jgi:flagellar biosynthetic protein FlhB
VSERPDRSEQTEEATPKKIEDALKKGQTPVSREVGTFASLLAFLAILALYAPAGTRELVATLSRLHDDAAGFTLRDGSDATAIFLEIYRAMASFLFPIVGFLALAGVAASLAQNAPRIVGTRIEPKLERISIMAGFKRIFGSQGAVEFLRSLFKFAVVGAIATYLLMGELPQAIRSIFVDPSVLPSHVLAVAMRLVAAVCAATILLVAADLVWTRLKWRRDLRMTRREVRDEMKDSEGDPILKARQRSVQKDRSRRRMLTAVPRATVVIANPTHFAVALHYVRGEGGAPKIVAKGVDIVALRIREIAEANRVPVVEDPPLARALYAAVEVDRTIPEEFYRAVAQVLHYVYSHAGRAAR